MGSDSVTDGWKIDEMAPLIPLHTSDRLSKGGKWTAGPGSSLSAETTSSTPTSYQEEELECCFPHSLSLFATLTVLVFLYFSLHKTSLSFPFALH